VVEFKIVVGVKVPEGVRGPTSEEVVRVLGLGSELKGSEE